MKRATLTGLWVATGFELLYLFLMTQRVHTSEEFVFGLALLFSTIALGAITIFAPPGER